MKHAVLRTARNTALRTVMFLGLFASLVCASQACAKPVVIAHRGASGYLPEHTLASYASAFWMGADVIEPDVVLSSDGVLICSHDITLETTTDVAQVFPGRARSDGKYYVIDFTSDEIAQLQKLGRKGGPRQEGHHVATFEQMIALVKDLNRETGRNVSIVPEAKQPSFHRKEGKPIEPALIKTLSKAGYTSHDSGCIIQCFELESLRTIREDLGSKLPLVFLMSKDVGDDVLKDASSFCDAISPKWTALVTRDGQGKPNASTGLAERAHNLGLDVYTWTFDADIDQMSYFVTTLPIEGFFTNYPDKGREAVDGAVEAHAEAATSR